MLLEMFKERMFQSPLPSTYQMQVFPPLSSPMHLSSNEFADNFHLKTSKWLQVLWEALDLHL